MSHTVSGHACRVQVLGPPAMRTAAGCLPATKPVVFGAALYLALQRGRPVSRTTLATLLWPDADLASRGERARWLVHQLRRAGIPSAARSAQLELAREAVQLDLDTLEAARSLGEALAAVRGDVMAGYDPRISDDFTRWLDDTRDAMRTRVLAALAPWLASARREARWPEVEEVARRMLALDGLHEGASLAQVEALVMQGRAERAMQVLARFRSEVGGDAPTPALRRIHRQVRELAESESRPRAPLAGRESVMAVLLESLEPRRRARRGVAVGGPPGIGTSRVLREVALAAGLRGVRVAHVCCSRADALRPVSLVADLARCLLAMRGALGAAPESVAVLRGVVEDVPARGSDQRPVAPRAALYAALRDVIGALLDDGPVAVIVDDAQWAEAASWEIVGPLVGEHDAVSWSVGVRCESREVAEGLVHGMLGGRGADVDLVWLLPLAPAELAAVCVARAAPREVPAGVLALLVERAGGIPFVAEALVQQWCEGGELAALPPSVARLVAARLERLSPAAAGVVEAVAVLGARAEVPAVEAVTSLDRASLLRATRELDAAGILRSREDGVLSVHGLWADAALARTPRATRQLLQRYAAEWAAGVAGVAGVASA